PITADLTVVHDPQQWTREFKLEDFDLEKAVQPVPAPDPSIFEVVDAVIAEFGRDRYVLGPCGFEVGMTMLGGMERGLFMYAEQPDIVARATEYELLRAEARDPHYIRPGAPGVLLGEDWGHKTGPLISPAMFRKMVLPAAKRRCQRLQRDFGLTVLKHCCGNLWKLMDMFLECGYDAYQSIQISAGMDLTRLKQTVGDKITLWGGVQVETLMSGTPAQVQREVEESFRILSPGGRFIFSTSHSVAVGCQYDNVMAMFDAYHNCVAKA
ncbi:MAG TPA: uroporphyrinogen decarboxylase family protein, partial [Planctomycetota bacterium]|nr:uroporphyrinogen decarboxylase family protein [Planctomycetota bacterium]